MEEQSLQYLTEQAVKKKQILDSSPGRYLLRAMLASIYASFVIVTCFKLGNYFFEAKSPAAFLVSAIFFGIALIMIIYGGAELFTGNTMYFTVATLSKATTWKDTLKNWTLCYGGNVLGALIFAGIFYLSGVFGHIKEEHMINYVADYKMHATPTELFFKGILCNWLVCLACFLPTKFKNEMAKLVVIMFVVFLFFAAGYEHSIANLCIFAISLLSPHPDTVTLMGALYNLIPVTIGNIIGGSVCMGMVYYYLNSKPKEKVVSLDLKIAK